MMKEHGRSQRVAGQLQRELAIIIQSELKDPRLGLVTVSSVDVSKDLSHARVYFTLLGDDLDRDRAVGILNKAGGFMRHLVGQRMRLRIIPQLRFIYDTSVERGTSLSELIDSAVASDQMATKDRNEENSE